MNVFKNKISLQSKGFYVAVKNIYTHRFRTVVPFATLTANLLRKCCRRSRTPVPTDMVVIVNLCIAVNSPINPNFSFVSIIRRVALFYVIELKIVNGDGIAVHAALGLEGLEHAALLECTLEIIE